MIPPDEIPKLRLAQPVSAAELAAQVEREGRAALRQREEALSEGLAPFRVGSVPYLNGVPLTRGLEDQITYVVPSRLAEMLQRDALDAALVSITEVLYHDRYDVLDGIAIASLGEVKSVFVAHRRPLEEAREIFCDPASLTSVNLAKVLLAERGAHPSFAPLQRHTGEPWPDFFLLIGDRAIEFVREPQREHEIWDLGAAWFELTRLPFVYAVWALRRGIENTQLRRALREAKEFGLDTLDSTIRSRTEFDLEFRQDYLTWHVHFHLGMHEKQGIARFVEMLRKHQSAPVYEPRYVT